MAGWARRKPKWDWHACLTEEEASEVRDVERQLEHARHIIASFQPTLNLIRNRAIQRLKHRARAADGAALSDRPGGKDE